MLDLGFVGEIEAINPAVVKALQDDAFIPVISPIGFSAEGQAYNINADLVAAAIGGALRADSVIFLTDVAGIYRSWPDKSSLIDQISVAELKKIAPTFTDGMIPKVKAAITAIDSGADSVRVTDGTDLAAVLDALDHRGGTLVSA